MVFKSINEYSSSELDSFYSGVVELDIYLKCYALKNDVAGYGKTFLSEDNNEIIGYFTLCSSRIEYNNLPYAKNLPKYPMPSIRIARLAVKKDKQHQGYGTIMIRQAFRIIVEISIKIGVYAVLVDAKDSAINFYKNFGFMKLLNKESTYFLPIETIKIAFNL